MSAREMIGDNRLTHSRLQCFAECPRKHYIRYELGYVPERTPDYFRFGGAYHLAQEVYASTRDVGQALDAVQRNYSAPPEWVQQEEDTLAAWYYEAVTVSTLFLGWLQYWAEVDGAGRDDVGPVEVMAVESYVETPIINPATGAPTPVFRYAGKIDQLVSFAGRVAIREFKTTSEPIEPDSDYWQRLRIDGQISRYMLAARQLWPMVETVLYDVSRKPSIRPTAVPELDADGVKIVLDAGGARVERKDGRGWKQTADVAAGEKLQTRRMTCAEWHAKLDADIKYQPGRYYARKEIPRLEADLTEAKLDLWHWQRTLRECQLNDRWPRNTSACRTYTGKCAFFDVCTQDMALDTPPPGFVRGATVHPELIDVKPAARVIDVHGTSNQTGQEESTCQQ